MKNKNYHKKKTVIKPNIHKFNSLKNEEKHDVFL